MIFKITKEAFVTSNPHKVRFLRYDPVEESLIAFIRVDFIEIRILDFVLAIFKASFIYATAVFKYIFALGRDVCV